jgi:DivIVA domain-containing protein
MRDVTWLWAALALAVLGATVAVAASRDAGMSEGGPDRRETRLPAGRALTDADLGAVRFTQRWRGYSMDEVDDFVDRVRAELAARPAQHASDEASEPAPPVEWREP